MENAELLRHVAGALDAMGIRYFVTGSTASIFYGEPRFTNDIDIVADLPLERAEEFCAKFPDSDYYVSVDAARDAVRRCSMFNIIHPESGLKVDIIIPERSEMNERRFARAREVAPTPDLRVRFSSPEDVIIHKMIFYQEGGSDKHIRDSAGILRISGESVDREYILQWAEKLRLAEIWEAILQREMEP
jgi:hypothetical protein